MSATNLKRFVEAQQNVYSSALREIQAGKKQSHWIWYVFPQLKGLGHSYNSEFYGIADLAEACAYLADPVLGQRLRESTEAMLAHRNIDATSILGSIDALKFKSCLTLFSVADPSQQLFTNALDYFYGGARDARTIELLKLLDKHAP